MGDVSRIEFDATHEEVADVNMRLLLSTKAYRRSRLQYQWAVGVVVAGVLAVTVEEHLSTPSVIALSAVCGFLSGYLYGPLYERSVRASYLRMVSELYGGASTVRCTFELRYDVLWTKMGSTELAFAWSDRVAINDAGDCIEVWFNPGLAVVRNRAFQTEADRRTFLEAAGRPSS